MTVDFTKPVRTVGGKHPVRIFCTDFQPSADFAFVAGAFLYAEGDERLTRWNEEGYHLSNRAWDLENVPDSKWVNLYPNSLGVLTRSRKDADSCQSFSPARIAVIEIIDGKEVKVHTDV